MTTNYDKDSDEKFVQLCDTDRKGKVRMKLKKQRAVRKKENDRKLKNKTKKDDERNELNQMEDVSDYIIEVANKDYKEIRKEIRKEKIKKRRVEKRKIQKNKDFKVS